MKKLIFTLLSAFLLHVSFGQILNPVKFQYKAIKKNNGQYEVHIITVVDAKWHIYSIYNPDGGAQATALTFKNATVIGKAKEAGKMKTTFEKDFGVDQKYFEESVDFIQLVKVAANAKNVSGSVEYMMCNDKQCLPPKTVAFNIAL